ncbi:MAG: GNAT family N-acetyltransferase [Candidatus Puniceispirillaceae bacterium]
MSLSIADDLYIALHGTLADIPAAEWDALNSTGYPFASYAFLHALEASGSVGGDSGWQPVYICMRRGKDGPLLSALPAYVKYHSYGEYVFDHSWAHAFERAGGNYYPKLLAGIPFTPVPGPRLLRRPEDSALDSYLISAFQQIVTTHDLSSAHINFITEEDTKTLKDTGWMIRKGLQFHWHNHNYADFDSFLASLSSRKRKNIRKERQSMEAQGIIFDHLTGTDIRPEHWDDFYRFYLSTIDKKWGGAYLTREFFTEIAASLSDKILLVMASQNGERIAGALNFIGKDTLYGRNWGCVAELPNLHFETCYYQALDFAISRGLKTVEAGAQGFHKVQRGYLPVYTYSAHWLPDAGFSKAVQRFLRQESAAMEEERQAVMETSPYRRA